jgi:hypothetical protein
MTTAATVSERLEQQGVLVVECSIPEDMTIAEWRRVRPRAGRRRPRRRGASGRTDAAATSGFLP